MKINKNNSISYSDLEKRQAHNMSTLDYIQRTYGLTFARKGNYYIGKEHDSLVIFGDERGWAWNSKGLKGADCISFVQQIGNKSYPEALEILLGNTTEIHNYQQATVKKPEIKVLTLPEATQGKYSRVFAYLNFTRRIAPIVINSCVKNKSLYQDKNGNCVFVGFDNNNKPAYGAIRGTLTEKKYRGDCSGSNKEFGFKMIFDKSKPEIYVFEAPIDAMSHATIANIVYKSDNAYKNQNRLTLGGLNTVHLDRFLKDNPQIKTIKFCLDNDYNAIKKDGTPDENHGQVFAEKCRQKYSSLGYTVYNICPKTKDFNDDLIKVYCGGNNKVKQNINGVARK